jgi:SWI/SNF-related matrix-associated actin-dependent regulator 1 of chromatin subfamily A
MPTLGQLLTGEAPVVQARPELQVPDLAIDLMDFQKDAVKFALSRNESYLALDMGLGKTACAIAIIVANAKVGNTPALVVCPPSLRINWFKEFSKFAPNIRVETLMGKTPYALPPADVYIMGDMTIASWAVTDHAKRTRHDLHGKIKMFVIDEAQRHKNYKRQRAKAMVSLANSVPGQRVLMSGTPNPNGDNIEFANQLHILGKQAWKDIGGEGRFWSYYAPKKKDERGRDDYGRDSKNEYALGEAMRATFMHRKRRDEVIELPNKGRSTVAIEGRGTAVRRYNKAEDDIIAYLRGEDKDVRGAMRAEALVKLNTLRTLSGLAKVPATIEYIEDMLDEPGGIFVVAEHIEVMDMLDLSLRKHGVSMIRGEVSSRDKNKAVEDFTSGKTRILIGQITSAGVGFTLHGNGLNNRVVITELPWTPADLRQAEDRLHRIGQTKEVHVSVTLCHIDGRWTLDERMWATLGQKAINASVTLDGIEEGLTKDTVKGAVLDSYR